MKKDKKILVDMTCSILHHGHIRLLKKASKYGKVIVALSNLNIILFVGMGVCSNPPSFKRI